MFAPHTSTAKKDVKDEMKAFAPSLLPVLEKQSKRDLYIKIFKEEFIREMQFIWDVANERAKPKDNFTSKIVSLLKDPPVSIPLISDGTLKKLGTAIEFAANLQRDKEMGCIANLYNQLDLQRLAILIDVVAREAYRRYEFFIENRLNDDPEDGVIPFAKVGVARVIEHMARKREPTTSFGAAREKLDAVLGDSKKDIPVEFSESFLLAGLVEGRSGQFIQGWTNNSVKLNRTSKNIFGQERTETVDAEDAYARTAFLSFDIRQENLVHQVYTRNTAKHKEKESWDKLKGVFKGDTDALFNFGYVQYSSEDNRKQDPLCGVVVMPLKAITERYDYKAQDEKQFSRDLQSELQRKNLSVVQIDKETLKRYVSWYRQQSHSTKTTVADYLRLKKLWLGAKWVICQEDLTGIDLKGVNLSYMDLSGAILSGDLTQTNFANSYLLSTRFIKVTSAKQANFNNAHCEFMRAEGVDFSNSDFTQADCSFAKLSGAKLQHCKLLGTNWHKADLTKITSDVDILKTQQTQLNQLTEDAKQQQIELYAIKDKMAQQSTALQQLNDQVAELIHAQVITAEATDDKRDITVARESQQQVETLRQTVAQLIEQQQIRESFEHYCRTSVKELQQRLQATANQNEIVELRQVLQSTQLQLRTFQQKNNAAEEEQLAVFTKQITQLSSQYVDLKQHLDQLPQQFKQICHDITIQQVQRCRVIENHIQQVEKELTTKIAELENRVGIIEQKLESKQPEMTVAAKIQKLRQMVLDDKFIGSELAYYVEPNGQSGPGMPDITPLHQWVEREFLESKAEVLLLQGDAGAGKSTFNRFLLRQLWQHPAWQSFKPGDKPPQAYLPIFIPLASSQVDPTKLLTYLLDLPELVEDFTDVEVNVLKRDYRLLLIGDGYDEMPQHTTINLYDTNHFEQYQGRIKLMIGCRTQRAQELDENTWFVPHDSNKSREQFSLYKKRHVAPFDDKQIANYLTKYLTQNKNNKEIVLWSNVATYEKYLQQIPELKTLITTPFLLMIMVEVLPGIIQEIEKLQSNSKDEKGQLNSLQLTRAKLYDRFVEGWFKRQENKLRQSSRLPKQGNITDDYREFCLALAQQFHQAKITAVQYPVETAKTGRLGLLKKPIAEKSNVWAEEFFGDKNLNIALAREGSPLRIASGNWHQFIHASLIDYFMTTAVWQNASVKPQDSIADIKVNNSKNQMTPATATINVQPITTVQSRVRGASQLLSANSQQLLNQELLNRDQLYFLADRVKQDKTFEDYLWYLIERSKKEETVARSAANAITILNAAEINFNGKDFKDIRIPGADLSGSLCDNTDFTNADLRNINFQGAWLREANWSNANVEGVRFGELPFIRVSGLADCSYSPNGHWLAVVNNKKIDLFNARTHLLVKTLEHTKSIGKLAWDKKSQHIALYDKYVAKTVHIWKVATGKELRSFFSKSINCIAWDAESERLALGKHDGLYVINAETGQESRFFKHNNSVKSVAWDLTGERIASGGGKYKGNEGFVYIWSLLNGEELFCLKGHTAPVNSINWHVKTERLASGGDSTARIWDTTSGKELQCLKHDGEVLSVAFDLNGKRLASGSSDNMVRVWDVINGVELCRFAGHISEVKSVSWDAKSNRLASGCYHSVRIWEVSNSKPLRSFHFNKKTTNILWDTEKRKLVLYNRNNSISILEPKSGKELRYIKPKRDNNDKFKFAIVFDSKSERLAIADDKVVQIWDTINDDKACFSVEHTHLVNCITWNEKTERLATGSSDGTVQVWDGMNGAELFKFTDHKKDIHMVAFDAKGEYLASCAEDKNVYVWNVKNGSKCWQYNDPYFPIKCIAWSDDSQLLAAGRSFLGAIKVWDIVTKQETYLSVSGYRIGGISNIVWDTQSKRLFSGGTDGTVRIWDVLSKKELYYLKLKFPVSSCCWISLSVDQEFIAVVFGNNVACFQLSKNNSCYQAILCWMLILNPVLNTKGLNFTNAKGLDANNASLLENQNKEIKINLKEDSEKRRDITKGIEAVVKEAEQKILENGNRKTGIATKQTGFKQIASPIIDSKNDEKTPKDPEVIYTKSGAGPTLRKFTLEEEKLDHTFGTIITTHLGFAKGHCGNLLKRIYQEAMRILQDHNKKPNQKSIEKITAIIAALNKLQSDPAKIKTDFQILREICLNEKSELYLALKMKRNFGLTLESTAEKVQKYIREQLDKTAETTSVTFDLSTLQTFVTVAETRYKSIASDSKDDRASKAGIATASLQVTVSKENIAKFLREIGVFKRKGNSINHEQEITKLCQIVCQY